MLPLACSVRLAAGPAEPTPCVTPSACVVQPAQVVEITGSDISYATLAESAICAAGFVDSLSDPLPGGWLGGRMAAEAAICGYQLVLPLSSKSELSDHYPKSWSFEGSTDGLLWTVIDARHDVGIPTLHATSSNLFSAARIPTPDGHTACFEGQVVITATLSQPVVLKHFRLHVHSIGASTGSMSGSTKDGKGLRLSGLGLLALQPTSAGASIAAGSDGDGTSAQRAALEIGWRLMLSGPPGQQRFRIVSIDRRLDMVAPYPLIQLGVKYHVRASVAVQHCPDGRSVLAAALSVDGVPCQLTQYSQIMRRACSASAMDMEVALPSSRLATFSPPAGASTAVGPSLLRGAAPSSIHAHDASPAAASEHATAAAHVAYPCAVALTPLRRVTIGGPSFAAAFPAAPVATATGGAGPSGHTQLGTIVGEPSLAYDSPGYPSSSLRCFTGTISNVTVSVAPEPPADSAAALPSTGAAAGAAAELVLRLVAAGRDSTTEEGGADSAAASRFPGGGEGGLRQRTAAAPLQTLEHALLWQPQPAVDALLRCSVPLKRTSAADDNVGRPRVLLCHDCGTAVYKEDSFVHGYHVPPPAYPSSAYGAAALAVEESILGALRPPATESLQCSELSASASTALPPALPPCKTSSLPIDPAGECMDPGLAADADLSALLARLLSASSNDPLPAATLLPPSSAARVPALSAALVQLPPLDVGHAYSFTRWHGIDAFVYFSHARVSIPPPGWIAAAHRSGVPVLGTIITEWADGARANEMLCAPYLKAGAAIATREPAAGRESANAAAASASASASATAAAAVVIDTRGLSTEGPSFMARQLADIAAFYGFDGWLINIESQCSGHVAISASAEGLASAKTAGDAASSCAVASEPAAVAADLPPLHPGAAADRRAVCDLHPGAAAMAAFVADLRRAVCDRVGPAGQVIWYDSVAASSGRVRWQSALNDENVPFLEAADGMFTDYHWQPPMVKSTAQQAAVICRGSESASAAASHMDGAAIAATDSSAAALMVPAPPNPVSRTRDVWVGVDMWGRGTYGGGGWNCRAAVDAILRESRAAAAAPAAAPADSACEAPAAAEAKGVVAVAAAAEPAPLASATSGAGPPAGPLSVALFAPAWTYEALGGAADASLFEALEAKLWDGLGAAEPVDIPVVTQTDHHDSSGGAAGGACEDVSAGSTSSIVPCVVNANGYAAATSDTERFAGWTVTESGGNGWAVEKLEESTAPEAGIRSCFVSSYAWCWAVQTVALRRSTSEPLPASVTASEWYAGAGPNHSDLYRFIAELVDAEGNTAHAVGCAAAAVPVQAADTDGAVADATASATVETGCSHAGDLATADSSGQCTCGAVFDSGAITTSAQWKRIAHTFAALPSSTVALRVRHGGKDVEHWAGHFGARMCGTSVTVPRSAAAAAARRLLGVATANTGAAAQLPLAAAASAAVSVAAAVGTGADGLVMSVPLSPAAVQQLYLLPTYRPLITADTLPFSSCFNTGRGAHLFREGAIIRSGPWVNIGDGEPQPCFHGLWATHGLEDANGTVQVAIEATSEAGATNMRFSGGCPQTAELAGRNSTSPVASSRLHVFITHRCAWNGGASILLAGRIRGPDVPRVSAASETAAVASFSLARLWTASLPLARAASRSPVVGLTFRGFSSAPSRGQQWQVLPVPVWQLESHEKQLALLWPSEYFVTPAAAAASAGISNASNWSAAEARFRLPAGRLPAGERCRAVCLLVALCAVPMQPESPAAVPAVDSAVLSMTNSAPAASAAAALPAAAFAEHASIAAAVLLGRVAVS